MRWAIAAWQQGDWRQLPILADIVAKVVLHGWSKILRTVGAVLI
jgi:hypothetical protein